MDAPKRTMAQVTETTRTDALDLGLNDAPHGTKMKHQVPPEVPPPTIEQIISSLVGQVVFGRAHLVLAKGLANSDPVVLNTATVFFGMSIDAHFYASQMHAARLHDDSTPRAVTVRTLLKRAGEEAGRAKYGSAGDVREAITFSEKTLSELAGPLKALTLRRNAWLAHIDERTITDPVKVAAAAGPHFPDLETIFDRTGDIVNKFSCLYRGIFVGNFKILDQTDYEKVIEFVSAAIAER
ncbi:MAG: AbiU2 domain-containing protein [Terriglobales bacterium]